MTFPFTSRELEKSIDALLKRHPFIHCAVIGRSRVSKPLYALEIKQRGEDKSLKRKRIFINAAHHANEWLTSPLIIRYLEEHAHELIDDGADFFFVPMVNPDGVDLVTGGLPAGSEAYEYANSLYAKHQSETQALNAPFPNAWKANAAGVDLNSNYPAGWWAFKQLKKARGFDAPGPREYVGPYPLSEPESAALVSYTRANNFDVTLSFHTQGEVIYWRYMDYMPPGAYELARLLAEASGYAPEDTPDESAHAGYKDWFIKEFNRPGFTIEFGLGENPLPVSQFETMYTAAESILETLRLYYNFLSR
jgi:g-D-glutamyl-meso-diaminopimelate peptidase